MAPIKVYVSIVNLNKAISAIADIAKASAEAKQENPDPTEREFAVRGAIPWDNIICRLAAALILARGKLLARSLIEV